MGDERRHVAESDPSGIDIPSLMPPSTPSLDQIYRIADCRSGQGPMGARREAALIRPRAYAGVEPGRVPQRVVPAFHGCAQAVTQPRLQSGVLRQVGPRRTARADYLTRPSPAAIPASSECRKAEPAIMIGLATRTLPVGAASEFPVDCRRPARARPLARS